MDLQLRANETVFQEVKADYWETLFGVIMTSQVRGSYCFTNQRIVFKGGFATEVEIEYSDIESISKCNVGGLIPVMPTGIKVVLKDGKKHILSVLKRGEIMDFIQSHIQ
ncbi:MAG: PH domain-containing protein [Acutalibacteraceae bacterium]|nr:PH domain-containing protein [Acutalibacteraceae bacterium]